MNELTKIESDILAECEIVIEKGLASFIDVGNALLKIRDGRLYKANFATFEDYCRERWGLKQSRAYQLMDAAGVVASLKSSTIVELPANEAQARPLTRFEPDMQAQIWKEVIETAPDGTVTAAHVLDTVERVTKPHVANNGGENEWYTPVEFVEAARKTMGSIDTDPASSEIANRTVRARRYYTKDDNGLEQKWTGNVWMNPPYAQPLIAQFCEAFVAKFHSYYAQDYEFEQGIVLVNNATETAWFQSLLEVSSAVCFVKGRIRFVAPDGKLGAPLQGQAILYFGENVEAFVANFEEFGKVLHA